MQIEWRKRLAKLTSNILNPFLVSAIMMVLLSFSSTSSAFDAIRWSLLLIAVSVLPVFIAVVYLVNRKQLDGIFVSTQKQRYKIYLMASTCAVAGCVVLYYLPSCFNANNINFTIPRHDRTGAFNHYPLCFDRICATH